MTKKKNSSPMKKLIPAAGMLMVSAMMLASSTYAWFSMNKTVGVTGLSLTAKSNSTYLLIGKGEAQDTAAEIQTVSATNPQTTVAWSISGESARVFPSAHNTVTNATDASSVGNWYFKVADTPNASTSSQVTGTALTTFDNYVVHDTVYLTLAKGSQAATNLTVSASTFAAAGDTNATGDAKTFAPVKVLVASPTGVAEFDKDNVAAVALGDGVNDSAVVPVDIYIYYDGNHADVFTNNIANLEGATCGLTFTVTYASDLST
jgi:hypothetical protein